MLRPYPPCAGARGVGPILYIERYCGNVERRLKGGFATILVLSAIDGSDRPIHGYAIIKRIRDRTGGHVTVGPGTVYPILRDLEGMGLVRHTRVRVKAPARNLVHALEQSAKAQTSAASPGKT